MMLDFRKGANFVGVSNAAVRKAFPAITRVSKDMIARTLNTARRHAPATKPTNDLIAMRQRRDIRRTQISVDGPIRQTGLDNRPFPPILHSARATVAEDIEEMARRATLMILAKTDGTPSAKTGTTVPMRPVVRPSTAIPNQTLNRRLPS